MGELRIIHGRSTSPFSMEVATNMGLNTDNGMTQMNIFTAKSENKEHSSQTPPAPV